MKVIRPRTTITGPNIGLWFLFGVVLIALRAFSVIDCSWWVAISPFYIPLLLFYTCAVAIYIPWVRNTAPQKVPLGFKKLEPEAKLPVYAHEGDAGMDVFALEDVELLYGRPTLVKTGIAAEIPDGYEIQVRPRSGMATKGVTVWNSPGTVDSKYRGEICVIMMFIKYYENIIKGSATPGVFDVVENKKADSYKISKGDKIAQLVLSSVTFAIPSEVTDLTDTDRGTAGFGSTGR